MKNLSPTVIWSLETSLNQARDAAHTVNTTASPDHFFTQLNFLLDLLLELQRYESYNIYTGKSISQTYSEIIENMEQTVDDFINRVIDAMNIKISKLTTARAKDSKYHTTITALKVAFDNANKFWLGNNTGSKDCIHYTGPLYSSNNYERVLSLYNDLAYRNEMDEFAYQDNA